MTWNYYSCNVIWQEEIAKHSESKGWELQQILRDALIASDKNPECFTCIDSGIGKRIKDLVNLEKKSDSERSSKNMVKVVQENYKYLELKFY